MKEHIEIIPEEILNSEIIGGDLNKMNTSKTEDGVYQTFNAGTYKKNKPNKRIIRSLYPNIRKRNGYKNRH